MVNVRDAATLRRVLLGLLLTWPILVVCGNPSFDLRHPIETIEVDDSGSGDAEGKGEMAQNTAEETLPADESGEDQTILNFNLLPISTAYGQLVISRDGFKPGQATSGLYVFVSNNFFPFVFHGASNAWIDVTGNPTGGAFDFVTRVNSTTLGLAGFTSARFNADDYATATCYDTTTPNQPVLFHLPVGGESRFTLPLSTPTNVTVTAHCDFKLETTGSAQSIPGGALHEVVLTLTKIVSSSPEVLNNLPPNVSPIEAVFDPSTFTTYYFVDAADPEGAELSYEWSGFNCGRNGPNLFVDDDRSWFWYHRNPPCTHPSSAHDDATIEVIVSDGVHKVSCTYDGAESGVELPESCARLAPLVDLP